MRVVLVNYGAMFAADDGPEEVLDELRSLTDWAEALRNAGAEVRVVQGFHRDAHLERQGIVYQFVSGRFSPRLSRRRIPWRLHRLTSRLAPDVVHLNGLLYGLQARTLKVTLPDRTKLVLQHHGEQPDRGRVAVVQRWGLRAADGFFFTSAEMAEPWRKHRLIRDCQPIFGIMEGSSRLSPMPRASARAETGMQGDPIFLWTANLDANKDPLTVLAAFEAVLEELPTARLYMAWRLGELLPKIKERLAASSRLSSAVTLLGSLPYNQLQPIFNSADFFLQGSHREGSGYSVADALACGTVPIITDIASFRFLTADGRIGALWPQGDAAALRDAILELARQPLEPQRQAARKTYEERLSMRVIGEQAVTAYRKLLDSPTRHQAGTEG